MQTMQEMMNQKKTKMTNLYIVSCIDNRCWNPFRSQSSLSLREKPWERIRVRTPSIGSYSQSNYG